MSSEKIASTGLAGRYATALYELADAGKQLDQVATDFQQLSAMINESADLAALIKSPVISRAVQTRAMQAVMSKAGLSPLTARFVGVLSENRRLYALGNMIAAYLRLLAARRGETTAEVISAKKLSDSHIRAIAETLKKAIGGKVAVDAKVDPGVLGGLVVKVGSRMIDSSLRTKMQRMRLAMKSVGP